MVGKYNEGGGFGQAVITRHYEFISASHDGRLDNIQGMLKRAQHDDLLYKCLPSC